MARGKSKATTKEQLRGQGRPRKLQLATIRSILGSKNTMAETLVDDANKTPIGTPTGMSPTVLCISHMPSDARYMKNLEAIGHICDTKNDHRPPQIPPKRKQ
ncbi:hypothetical protein HAX54_044676 [Datura stramonium]|uniref:Uncharacterized protein n=1 Tax=Datura stramonium TaxID=4076 RepID=A0ABS8SQ35_DATST|nr:hypothetical protein [Datura stramonium]